MSNFKPGDLVICIKEPLTYATINNMYLDRITPFKECEIVGNILRVKDISVDGGLVFSIHPFLANFKSNCCKSGIMTLNIPDSNPDRFRHWPGPIEEESEENENIEPIDIKNKIAETV